MVQTVIKGEVVYHCNICNRKTRVSNNIHGLNVICHCTITANCKGKLSRVLSSRDILDTPNIPPEIPGVSDWAQRRLLFNHTQTVPMKVWVINHKLSNNPVFDVRVNVGSGDVEFFPTIVTVNQDTTNLVFDKAYSGIAQAITLSSQQSIPVASISVDNLVQISNNGGLLSIATLDAEPNITVQLAYTINNLSNTVLPLTYTIDDNAQASSPWASSNAVVINGQSYTVRSINLIQDPNNYYYFASNTITQLSSLVLSNINGSPVAPNSVLILLASTPFSTNDKIYNKVISFDQVLPNQIIYQNGVFHAPSTIIKEIYPYIHVV